MDGKGNEKPLHFTKFVPKLAPDSLGGNNAGSGDLAERINCNN
jgi:hypothetical protein